MTPVEGKKSNGQTVRAMRWRNVMQAAIDSWQATGPVLRNEWRLLRGIRLDYVVMPVGGPLPERAAPPRPLRQRLLPLPPDPLSLQELNGRLQAVADAANVKGVVLVLERLLCGLATVQNLRRSMQRLREAGKEVVVYTPYLDLLHYFAATAADRIIAPPSTRFEVLGLQTEAVFLKDALDHLGIHADVIQISPYKTAGDTLSRRDMSPEQREQLDWLLDENYDLVTGGIAEGRRLSQAEVKSLIDDAPFSAERAQAAGLVDHLAYEDELAKVLACSQRITAPAASQPAPAAETTEEEASQGAGPAGPAKIAAERPPVQLVPWARAHAMLLEKPRRRAKKFIGVVSLEGMIAMGPSHQPPVELPIPMLGGAVAGEQTISQLLRAAEGNEAMAALIFHVDSPGGTALAADLISRDLKRVARKKPVIVYMGNVAASGGYYVSAPAAHIMAQTGTVTGSIGVIVGRMSTAGLFEKLRLNRVHLGRGRHVTLNSDARPLTEEEQQILRREIVETYDDFKQVVAEGRRLEFDALDPICEGKVWTGRQAQAHGLVDSHGDFVDALRQATVLAGLPTDDEYAIPVANFHTRSREHVIPQPFDPVEWLFGPMQAVMNGRPALLMPFEFKIR